MDLFEDFIRLQKSQFEKPRVLDIGCGSGRELTEFVARGIDTVGIDFSFEGEKIIKGDFLKHDFGVERFSGIFVKDVLHLFPLDKRERLLEKIYNLLDEKGLAYFSVKVKDLGEGFTGLLNKKGFKIIKRKIRGEVILGKRDFEIIVERG